MLKWKIKQVVLPATRSEDSGAKPTAAQMAENGYSFDLYIWSALSASVNDMTRCGPRFPLQWPIIAYMCKKINNSELDK